MQNSKKRLLAVLAHPDDESFGMGGTLALYARKGVEVFLICATRGEAGEADAEHLKGFSSIGEMREAELRCAAGILGLTGVSFLGYRDSGMQGSPDNLNPLALINHRIEEVAEKVFDLMQEIKPDVVLTFDPIGGYRHPDHIHIHRATVMAFHNAINAQSGVQDNSVHKPSALYFHTISHAFLKWAILLLKVLGKDARKFGRNGDIDLLSIVQEEFPVHVRVNIRQVLDEKIQAGACHSSQGGGPAQKGMMGWLRRFMGASETYMRGFPPADTRRYVARDLFAP